MATHWLGLVDQLVYAKTFCIDQLQKLLVRLQFLWCIHEHFVTHICDMCYKNKVSLTLLLLFTYATLCNWLLNANAIIGQQLIFFACKREFAIFYLF